MEVADYKYVVLDDPLPTGDMIWCMRNANFHSLLSDGSR